MSRTEQAVSTIQTTQESNMTNKQLNEMGDCECIAVSLAEIIDEDGAALDDEDREALQDLRDKYNERFTALHARWTAERPQPGRFSN